MEKTHLTDPVLAMDVVLKAGRILMESGAEVYRVEETMSRIADAIGLEDFETYVVNRGIMVSADNAQAKVITTKEIQIHLGKLAEVNNLSRQIVSGELLDLIKIKQELKLIEEESDHTPLTLLLAYFLGAGGFSFSLGGSIAESLAAALTGVALGLAMNFLSNRIRTSFILTIIGSCVVTLTANLLYIGGLGEHRSWILLGALMTMVPGAFFVNAVREISQNNHLTGSMLMMTALLTCISISVGIAGMNEILPFAAQLGGGFNFISITPANLVVRSIAAGIGTVAFSILYHVPKRHFLDLGILGGISWFLYLLMISWTHDEVLAVLIPALVMSAASQILAIIRKSPASIFISTSMFPLIPGLSFYRGIYFLLIGNSSFAMGLLRSSFVTAFTLAIAISVIQQIPFRKLLKL